MNLFIKGLGTFFVNKIQQNGNNSNAKNARNFQL
jgi:hypothetical protein